jgi:hypothetical protein
VNISFSQEKGVNVSGYKLLEKEALVAGANQLLVKTNA